MKIHVPAGAGWRVSGAATTGLCLALTLAACGGGGGSVATPAPPPAPTVQAVDDPLTLTAGASADLAVLTNDVVSGGTPTLSVATPPAHGKVTVQGTTLRYTPDAGFYGADQFTYRLDLGSATSTATVKLTVETELELSGKVMSTGAAGMEITAQVGERKFTATADAAGAYKVSIKSGASTDFIRLSAKGSGTQASLVLDSQVGDFGSLASLAAAPKISELQWGGLRLDALSLARRGLMQQKGPLPSTGAALRKAMNELNPSDVFATARVLDDVLSRAVPLEPGVNNTLDLAVSAEALKTQVKRVSGAPPDDYKPLAPDAVPLVGPQGTRVAVHEPSTGITMGIAALQHLQPVFDLRPDGSATVYFHNQGADSKQAATWTQDAGIVTISLAADVYLAYIASSTGQNIYIAGYQFQRAIRSADDQASPWLNLRMQTRSRGCSTMLHTCTESQPSYGSWHLVRSFELDRDRKPFVTADFQAGRNWAGAMASTDAASATCLCIPQLLSFNGTPSVARLNDQLTDQGQWLLSHGNFAYRYTRLWQGPEGFEYWLAEIEQAGVVVNATLLPVAGVSGAPVSIAVGVSRYWAMLSEPERVNLSDSQRFIQRPAVDGSRGFEDYYWVASADGRTLRLYEGSRAHVYLLTVVAKTADGYLALLTADGFNGSPGRAAYYNQFPALVKLIDMGPAS